MCQASLDVGSRYRDLANKESRFIHYSPKAPRPHSPDRKITQRQTGSETPEQKKGEETTSRSLRGS